MARLFLATGDRFGRLDDSDTGGDIDWSLEGSGAATLAVDPSDPNTL